MEILRRSPMFGILAALTSGLAFYDRAGAWAFIILAPLIFTGVSFLSYENDLPGQWQIFFAGLGLVILCSARIFFVLSMPDKKIPNFYKEIGVISQIRKWGKNYAAIIETENYGKLVTRLYFAEYMEGTKIKFDGVARPFKNAKSPGDFDEKKYWKAHGVESWVNIRNAEELSEKFSPALIRYKISYALTIKIPKLTGEYLKAAWLGQHTEELDAQHRKWGTSHLLAVSGFHVGLAIMFAEFFFGKNFFCLSLIMWTYIFLTGMPPSAMRASLMFQLGLITQPLFGRKTNGVNIVSVAAVILLLFRPFLFWDIGWRLSVISALTITMMPREKYMWLFIGPAVSMTTFPQIITTFKTMPYAGFIINLFAPFYFSMAFLIASVSVFLALINFPVVNNFLFSVEGIFLLWERIADTIADLIPGSMHFNIYTLSLWTGAAIFFACRYFNFSLRKTFFIVLSGIFAAYIFS